MTDLAVDMTRDEAGPSARLLVAGELDDTSAATLKQVDFASLSSTGCQVVQLDLSELEFMDSSGIGALVGLRNRASAQGMKITLESVPVHIAHTLAMTGLAQFFGLRPTSA